ncbi:MAG: fibronectin type III domain-containing protein [Bacteroides sp.]|nr:fibronectin type III domain-containing protein [Eubacterium sp.]MCM1417615.1 fibronectin type III domain-containing protein [Roseburia sp.]MCM1461673.1 fibronectin type III domain-containing protein [Bacteroides sp.]
MRSDYEQVSLTPGANETQLNFAWYSKTAETPAVQIARSADMGGAVEFKGTQTENTDENALGYYSNKVTVTGLEENTQYYYRVFKNGEWSDAAKYSAKGFGSYSVLYVGDPQIGACKGQTSSEGDEMSGEIAARNDAFNWNTTLENALSAHPNVSFMLSAGDQVNTATNEYEYAGYLFPGVLDSLPVSTTIGNHDSGSYQYSAHFNNPNSFDLNDEVYALGHTNAGTDYYYTYGNVLFVVVDTNNYNCAAHKAVIDKAVKENPAAKWRVVMFHQDIYGSGLDHSDSDGIVLRTQLTPIFDEYDIDVVLQGHDHTYSRTYQLSDDGKAHAAYDGKNYKDADDFSAENNCYNILSSANDGGKVIDPEGAVYMEANSSTGSKFYELTPVRQDYIAERSQTWTPSYSVIDFTETTVTISTYDALTNKILEGSSPYTIVKKADRASLENAVNSAKAKLSDTSKYSEKSLQNLRSVLEAAQKIIDDPEATSEKIASAEADITNAAAALTENNGETGDSNTPSGNNPNTGVTDHAPVVAMLSFAGLALIVGSELKKRRKNG